jgi:hypothetical protein
MKYIATLQKQISIAEVKTAYIWKLQLLFGKDYALGEENIKARLAEP